MSLPVLPANKISNNSCSKALNIAEVNAVAKIAPTPN
jgi:hypothetical protein